MRWVCLALLLVSCRPGVAPDATAVLAEADALLSAGEIDKAEALLSKVRNTQGDTLARLRMHQGYCRLARLDMSAARRLFAEADRSAVSEGVRKEIAVRRGVLLVRAGKFGEAQELFRSSLAYARSYGDAQLELRSAGNLGVLALRQSRYEEAIYWLEHTRRISERLRDRASVARAAGNMGWCFFRLGDYDRALALLREATSMYQSLGNLAEQQVWRGNVASVYYVQRRFGEARAEYEQSLKIARDYGDRESEAQWLSNLALVAIEQKDWAAAEKRNNEALAIKNELKIESSRLYSVQNAGRIALGRGQTSQAQELFREVLRGKAEPGLMLDARLGLAEVYARLGDSGQAVAEFRSAIDAAQVQSAAVGKIENRASYSASLIRLYRRYVDHLMATGRTWEALEVAESSRGRLLDLSMKPSLLDAGALRSTAKRLQAALLSFWIGPEKSRVWAITSRGVQVVDLPSEERIRQLVTNHRGFVEALRDPLASEHAAGRRLTEMLLGGLDLEGVSELIIVPDGPLHALNFDGLPYEGGYVIDRYSVAHAPALRTLLRQSAAADGTALLAGDMTPAGEEFPKLRFSAAEIDAIERVMPGEQVILRGPAATLDGYFAARPERFGLIHLSAHAVADHNSPLESAVLLSPRDGRYRLSARDLLATPLRAGLVTVSACRGAGARSYSGEGLMGLTWAILQAGAGNVISGLWDVNDRSTALLMELMYSDIARGLPPGAALRNAKRALARTEGPFRLPYYWGAIQLYRGGS